jgi:hypothetical protein
VVLNRCCRPSTLTAERAMLVLTISVEGVSKMTKEAIWKSVLFWAVLVITGVIIFFASGGFR